LRNGSATFRSQSSRRQSSRVSHLLSGAVINPRAFRRLFKDRYRIEDLPSYGPVHGESV